MLYREFREKVKHYPVFRSNIFAALTDSPALLRDQVVDWVKKGLVICLKRGVYTLNESDREAKFSVFFVAQELYLPSFISLESALSYYGLIPEKVIAITSVTSKKTQNFRNILGNFIYRHLKTSLFNNFVAIKDEYGNFFNIAIPEKAIVDYLYFQTRGMSQLEPDIFEESFRLQNLEGLDKFKLQQIAANFNNKRLDRVMKMFYDYLEQNYA